MARQEGYDSVSPTLVKPKGCLALEGRRNYRGLQGQRIGTDLGKLRCLVSSEKATVHSPAGMINTRRGLHALPMCRLTGNLRRKKHAPARMSQDSVLHMNGDHLTCHCSALCNHGHRSTRMIILQ